MAQVQHQLNQDVPLGHLNPRKLPPNHMQFHCKDRNGLIVVDGKPYNERGEPLPLDVSWLRRNKYHIPDVALKAMSANLAIKETPPMKQCSMCAIELDLQDKFCKGCGQAQIIPLWTPGDGISDAAKGLIDPDDPLASLQWLLDPLPATPVRRVTPEEMGPTAQDATVELAILGKTLQGMPLPGHPQGDGITAVQPNFATVPKGVVQFHADIAPSVMR